MRLIIILKEFLKRDNVVIFLEKVIIKDKEIYFYAL